MRLPVCHFLDNKAESTDTLLFLKVVIVGLCGKEEGVVVVGGAGEERRVGSVDGGMFSEDKVVLVLNPGMNTGIA